MRFRIIMIVLVTIAGCVGSVPAAAQTRVDVKLEGPWLLYIDKSVATWPVLVAVSPGNVSDDSDNSYFHTVSVSAGDGYPVLSNGIYCFTFDGVCGKKGASSLDPDGYPSNIVPLPVNSPKGGWDWSSKWKPPYYAIVFILPVPDSYSTDGTWNMRFGKTYDKTGKTYKFYNNLEQYSIGVQLHYSDGPKVFNLQRCNSPIDLTKCVPVTDVSRTAINNTGTLSIAMKSPDSSNACDFHVRRAYPQMIALLGAGVNSEVAVIDLAKGSDASGKGKYDQDSDDYRCLDHDIQGGGSGKKMAMMSEHEPEFAWNIQLNHIAGFIHSYLENPEGNDPRLADKGLLLIQINDAIAGLDMSFPKFSQLTLITSLLRLSETRADTLLLEVNVNDSKSMGHFSETLSQLHEYELRYLASNPPSKNGNDCKAPLMLVAP